MVIFRGSGCQTVSSTTERKIFSYESVEDKRAYHRACRRTHKVITTSRASHICDEVTSVADNPRLLWKTVRRVLHTKSYKPWFEGLDTSVFANGISTFFVDKVKQVKAKMDAGLRAFSGTITNCPHKALPSNLSSFAAVTPSEVERLIETAPSKTSSLDIIPISILKCCKAKLSVMIANIANICFSRGEFPSMMKSGLVSPLLKKPGLDPSDFKNFRPITNLSMM